MKAFTLWTLPALHSVESATTADGRTYGISFFGEVWFRFDDRRLYCHVGGQPDAKAIMERRGS